MTTKRHAAQCQTHHHACDCREYRYEQMERALKVIHTWASYDFAHDSHPMTLDPQQTMALCDKALGRER